MKSLLDLKNKIKQESLISKPAVVEKIYENYIFSKGPIVPIGSIFENRKDGTKFEVVGINEKHNILMPLSMFNGLVKGEKLYETNQNLILPENPNHLLGKVLNALGESYLENRTFKGVAWKENNKLINSLKRKRITESIETKIKAIDGLLTIGRGQKIGIFAGTGVGKSTLLGLIAKQSSEDVNVIALIGERGREVREFIEKNLGADGMKRSVVVVATSDESSLMQLKAAELATRIAEEFRDNGKNVLLMMDSVTRYAQARRELDIANGEIPVSGGKTLGMEPSLKRLLEKSGNNDKGSITGIYTVLVENDDFNSPITDIARGILDGHIVLTRRLADKNHFPAIDVLSSVSRVMQDIVDEEHWKISQDFKKYLSIFEEIEDQYRLGLIEKGKDPEIDKAVELNQKLIKFLQQDIFEDYSFSKTKELLREILS